MRIIKLATEFPFTCTKCACEFLYEENDLRKGQFFDALTCPNCNEETGKEHLDWSKGEVWSYVYENIHYKGRERLNRVLIFARKLAYATEDPSIMRSNTYDVYYSYSLKHETVYPGRHGGMYIATDQPYDYGILVPEIVFDSSKF